MQTLGILASEMDTWVVFGKYLGILFGYVTWFDIQTLGILASEIDIWMVFEKYLGILFGYVTWFGV